jgi:transmembrane sensor
MSEIVKLRTRADIDEEAAVWIWRMDSAAVAAADRQAYEAWLRQDPRHRRAAAALSTVWNALDGLAEAKRDEKIATFAQTAKLPLLHHPRRWWFAAAAFAAAAVGAIWLQQGGELQTLATAVGQQRNVTLADGSIVTLNTNTIVETDLRRHSREIYLRKGEAHFQVAHDRSRPFLVHAGDAVVRAVGTAFEVRVLTDQHVDVVVDEGRVEVQATALLPPSPSPGTNVRARRNDATTVRALNAGERLSTASRNYVVTPVTPQQMSSELAWREGAIIFDGEPLSEAIAEIERYTDARIVVSDPEIARLRVGGRFRTGDMQEFFDALQTALPVSIRHADGGPVFIDPRR